MIQHRIPVISTNLTKQIASKLQKSAKLRAPRASGQLAASISVSPIKNGFLMAVNSPYGVYQEEGFAPHVISGKTPSRAGYRFIDWLQAKGYSGPEGVGFVVKKSKPFVRPALNKAIAELNNDCRNAAMEMIKK